MGPAEVVAALDVVGRHDDLVVVLWLALPNRQAAATNRELSRARAAPYGVTVARTAKPSPLTTAASALLTLHVALLRRRTPAQWKTLDVRRKHRTAKEAAEALGCTHQTVSRSLDRSDLAATRNTRSALVALLELATTN